MKKNGEKWSLFRLSDRNQFDNVSLDTVDFFFRALDEKSRIEWLMWRDGFSGWRPFSELPLILKHLGSDESKTPAPPPVPEAVLEFTRTGLKASVTKTVVETTASGEEADVSQKTATHSSVSLRALHAATSSQRAKSETNLPPRPGSSNVTSTTGAPAPSLSTRGDNVKVLTMDDEATLSLMLESQAASEDRDNVRYPHKFKIRVFTPQGVLAVVTADCSTSGFRLHEPLPSGLPRFFHVEIDLGLEGKIPLICSEIREKDGRGSTRVRIQVNDHVNALKSALVRAA